MLGIVFDVVYYLLSFIWAICWWVGGIMGALSFLTFIIMQLFQLVLTLLPVQNLKKKYNADWALVTGASSGIGKAIALRLLDQGISVVIAARDDQVLNDTVEELRKKYKDKEVTIRSIPVDLSCPKQSYMAPIIEGTKDIDVQLLFNNAGYILPGLFATEKLDSVSRNFNCLATCNVPITHHFINKMHAKKLRGLVTFTSSAGGYLLGPTATMYSCSKAFVTNLATTLAAENKDIGIDVTVIHPSPILTNFYTGTADKMQNLASAMKIAQGPDVVAKMLFQTGGRVVQVDQGPVTFGFRLLNKTVDVAFLNQMAYYFSHTLPDHVNMRKMKPKQE